MQRVRSWLSQQFKGLFPQPTIPVIERNVRGQCQFIYGNMDVSYFSRYGSKDGIGYGFAVAYATIDTYTDKILEHAELVELGGQILPETLHRTLANVDLNEFFVSHDGFYQNAEQVVANLRNAILRLCKALDAEGATQGLADYNRRLLTPLLLNLKDIGLTLVEVSIQNN